MRSETCRDTPESATCPDLHVVEDETDPSFWAEKINSKWQETVQSIIQVGRLLIDARETLDRHGHCVLVNELLPLSQPTIAKLTAIAKHSVLSNHSHVNSLPASWGTLYELTLLPEPRLIEALGAGTITPEMQRRDAVKLRKYGTDNEDVQSLPLQQDDLRAARRRIAAADRRLVEIRRRALDARKTALGNVMGPALRDIADEMVKLRHELKGKP